MPRVLLLGSADRLVGPVWLTPVVRGPEVVFAAAESMVLIMRDTFFFLLTVLSSFETLVTRHTPANLADNRGVFTIQNAFGTCLTHASG